MKLKIFLSCLGIALIVGCNAPINPSISSAPSSSTEEMPVNPAQTPERRIAIRVVSGQAEFFDRETGQRFIPRGPNFLMLALEDGNIVDHLFSPRFYDSAFVDQEMKSMRSLGYNVVRIALDICQQDCIGSPGGGLRDEFLANIADFINLAKANGLYVLLQTNDLPLQGGYVPKVESTCCAQFDGYMNSQYLSPLGVEQWRQYWTSIMEGLIAHHAALDTIFAYGIRGELFLFNDQPPLSLTSGIIPTANGKSYDMADPAQKTLMIQENIASWISTLADVIHRYDPTALIEVGIFPPAGPNAWLPNDNRYVPVAGELANTEIDFLDLHPYPGYVPLEQLMENFQLQDFTQKPIIIGEFGGFKFAFGSPQAAARGLQQWQVDSCKYNVQGWFFWHWTGDNDHEVWTGSEGDGAIREALAPVNRPDPCVSKNFDFFESNLALGKPVRVSRFAGDGPGGLAVDGLNSTFWQSGAGPTQWIEVNLEQPFTVQAIRLFTSQYPDGDTVHQLFVAGADHNLTLVYEFKGFTRGDQLLEYIPPEPLVGIQFVRVRTISSPSFVSWKEIEIQGK